MEVQRSGFEFQFPQLTTVGKVLARYFPYQYKKDDNIFPDYLKGW